MQSKIFDPVHKFIEIDAFEATLIKTLPFKRLQAIHQIGASFFVYGGGNHKRFDHSLGTLFVATKIYDKVMQNTAILKKIAPDFDKQQKKYWRKILRAAALCHDLGHLPFSHLAETELLKDNSHEDWTVRIIKSDWLLPIWEKEGLDVEHICRISVGEKVLGEKYSPLEQIITEMLTGDFFGADRIDYLLRDSYFTGLAYGSFDYHQLIDSLKLLEINNKFYLGIDEDGLESTYSLLLARYFMHKRLYQNPLVKSYNFHLTRFIKLFFEGKNYLNSVNDYLKVNDYDILSEINRAIFDSSHFGYFDALALMDQGEKHLVHILSKEEKEILLQTLDIIDNKIFFDQKPFLKSSSSLTFPVLLKNGMISPAKEIAEVKIPVNDKNWVFISPDCSEEFRKQLDHVAKVLYKTGK